MFLPYLTTYEYLLLEHRKKDAQKTVEKGAKMGFYHIRTWNIWSIYAYKAPEKIGFGADTPIYD